jgi:two-component system NtrC family sensor kinase
MRRFPRFVTTLLQQSRVPFGLLQAPFRRRVTRKALAAARAELDDEHHRLELIVKHAPIGIVLVDSEGRFVMVNPAFCEMLGYARHELEGRPFIDFVESTDPAAELERFRAEFLNDTGGQYERTYRASSGEKICALVTLSPATGQNPADAVRVAQIKDVTERKRVEAALADERQLLTAFLQATPDQVYFKDRDSRFLRASDAQAHKLAVASAEELIGRTDFDFFSPEHAQRAFDDEQRIIRTAEPIIGQEEREVFPDGRIAWAATTKLPLRDAAGTIIGTCGISQDITARRLAESMVRESEERWRTLLANSQELVTLANPDGVLTYVSPSIARWLGHDPEDLVGADAMHLLHPDDIAAFRATFAAAAADTERRQYPIHHRLRHQDGTWHSLESTLVGLVHDPAVGAVLVTARDVTDWMMLERERQRLDLQRRVSQRLEAVGQLAAGVAHEINTPMQFVSDSVTFLRESVETLLSLTNLYRDLLHTEEPIDQDERRRRTLEAEEEADLDYLAERIPGAFDRTVDGIGRVTSIVKAMKRFSHASSVETTPADLNEALETTLAVCRNEYKYVADVELTLGELPLVICNVGELNQVFLNLIINAAQAIGEIADGSRRRGMIRIASRVQDGDVVIDIADDGPGIPPELQERIYEPFFTTKEIGQGSGQGLAIARTAIEQHSGSIECASAPGRGTTFTLHIPIQRSPRDAARVA